MTEKINLSPEDSQRYQTNLKILFDKNNKDPLVRITARCSAYWFQLKCGRRSHSNFTSKMSQYLNWQEKKNPEVYHRFIEEKDDKKLSMAIKLRENILGPGNFNKYKLKSRF